MEDKEIMVELQQITSCENYVEKDPETNQEKYRPVLEDISLTLYEGQVLGISSKEVFETQIFCRIVGNIIPYYSGKCVLGNRGMMQKKRLVLEHVFFIDVDTMVYDNMTVLEYLMLATAQSSKMDAVVRQKQIFDSLIEIGLGYISLTEIKLLTPEEKVLIELLTATYSKSKIIVLDITQYNFTLKNIDTLKKICNSNRKRNKTVIIGTMDAKIIGICCDLAAFILNGRLSFFGTVSQLYRQADRVMYVLTHSSSDRLYEKLVELMPEYEYSKSDNMIFVMRKPGDERNDQQFFDKLAKHKIFPDNVKINRGRVQNSFEELIRLNDI